MINVGLFVAVVGSMAATTKYFTIPIAGIVYPLDDTYIHLAMARTLSNTGVWGIYPSFPATASSSPLWTSLLALLHWLPPIKSDEAFSIAPLLLNVAAGVGAIALWRAVFASSKLGPFYTLVAWVAVPLPVIAFIGMEHALHVLLALALAYVSARAIASEQACSPAELGIVAALAFLAMATRYESAFLIASLCALSLIGRKPLLCAALVIAAAAAVLLFGIIWLKQGDWLLPNSVLLKGMDGSLSTDSVTAFQALAKIQNNLLSNCQKMPLLLASVTLITAHAMRDMQARTLAAAVLAVGAIALSIILFQRAVRFFAIPIDLLVALVAGAFLVMAVQTVRKSIRPDALALFGLAVVSTTMLQLMLGSVGWLYRYEAWLVALNITAILLLLERYCGSRKKLRLAGLATLALGALWASAVATAQAVKAPADRVWEHFEPNRFLNTNYRGDVVVVNDIGVIGYYGKTTAIDIYGLGHSERVRRRLQGLPYGAPEVAELARSLGAKIAVLQMCWEEPTSRIPSEWRLVALWQGPRNVVFGDLLVGFLALDERNADALDHAMTAFAKPAAVKMLDRSSALVSAFNAADNKGIAARELCAASLK